MKKPLAIGILALLLIAALAVTLLPRKEPARTPETSATTIPAEIQKYLPRDASGQPIEVKPDMVKKINLSPEQEALLAGLTPEEAKKKVMEMAGPAIRDELMKQLSKLPPEARDKALRALSGQDIEGAEVHVMINGELVK